MPEDLKKRFKEKRLKNHLKVILANVFQAFKDHPELYVAISMDKNKYSIPKRYANLYLSYKYVKFIVDYLVEQRYLEFHKGVSFKHFSRCARIKATQKLLRLFKEYMTQELSPVRRTLPLILRNPNKKPEYFDPNQDEVKNMIHNVNKINKCLARHKIEIPELYLRNNTSLKEDLIKYKSCQKYTRIFNNSSFENGGRFYCHWTQGIHSDARHMIHIDGERTVELDYSCLHIYMLYCLEGVRPPARDLYDLKGIDSCYRSLIKVSINIAFNASDEKKACQAIRQEIYARRKGAPLTPYPTPEEILAAAKLTHPVISKYFCTGMGIKLQKMDSQIAEKILLWFAERDICCLSIHDSFIVGESNINILNDLMNRYFIDKFHYPPRISRKYFSFDDDPFESEETKDNRINIAA